MACRDIIASWVPGCEIPEGKHPLNHVPQKTSRSSCPSAHPKVTVKPGAAGPPDCHRKRYNGCHYDRDHCRVGSFQPDTDGVGHAEPHHHRPELMYISHIYRAYAARMEIFTCAHTQC